MNTARRLELQRPPVLRPGDVVAIVSPSSPGPVDLPTPYRRGLAALRAAGYVVQEMPHGQSSGPSWTAPISDRVWDLHAAVSAPDVRAIVCSIGGNHAAQLLPHLDLELLAEHPTIFCGYSDATPLHAAFHRAGVISFYGPALIPQWGAVGGPLDEVVDHWRRVVGTTAAAGALPRFGIEIHDRDFARAESAGQPLTKVAARPRRALREGRATGPLFVACIPSLRMVIGTPWEPDLRGAIVILETPGPHYRLADADADLTHIELSGLLDEVAGVGLCRPYGYTTEEDRLLGDLLIERVPPSDVPVVSGLEGGHTDPLPTYPLGVTVELADTDLTILEPAVAEVTSLEEQR